MTQIQPSPQTESAAELPTSEHPSVPAGLAPATRRRRPWHRRWPAVLAAVVLVVAGVTLGLVLTGSSPSSYTSYTVATGSVSQTVTASGTLQPVTSSDVNFQVSGTVDHVAVSQGQAVSAGQTLATLDTTSLQLSLQEAQANLSSAESTLSSDQDSGASSSTIESDEAQVTSAQSSLTQAQDNLNDATLTAPIAGTVMTLNLAIGDDVSGASSSSSSGSSGTSSTGSSSSTSTSSTGSSSTGSSSTGSSSTGSSSTGSSSTGSSSSSSDDSSDVVIEDLSQFEVSASVSASSASSVKVGDQAVVTPSSSSSSSEIFGTVGSVASVPTVSSGVATFPVVIGITGSPSGLYSGTSASASIITEQRTGVLVVPSTAVTESGGGAVVQRLVDGNEVPTRVTTGLEGGSDTQVTAGLRSGDKVAVPVVSSGSATTGTGSGESPFGGFGRDGITGGSGFDGVGGGGFTGTGGTGSRSFVAP